MNCDKLYMHFNYSAGEQVPDDVKIYLLRIYQARRFWDLTSGLLSYAFAPTLMIEKSS